MQNLHKTKFQNYEYKTLPIFAHTLLYVFKSTKSVTFPRRHFQCNLFPEAEKKHYRLTMQNIFQLITKSLSNLETLP